MKYGFYFYNVHTCAYDNVYPFLYISLSTVVLSIIGIDMVPSITDVWGYDREFCSSSSSTRTSQKPYNIESRNLVIRYISIFRRDCTYLKFCT